MPMSVSPKGYRVYRNINSDLWTVQAYKTGKGWRKDAGVRVLLSKGNTYKVYEAGKIRVREEKKKNVHAYVLTDNVTGFSSVEEAGFWYYQLYKKELEFGNRITYDPYKHDNFIWEGGGEITYSHLNIFDNEGKVFNLIEVEPEGNDAENTDNQQPEDY